MADISNIPTIFDGLSISKLKIRGASYQMRETRDGRGIMVPFQLIFGYGNRRWELTVSDTRELVDEPKTHSNKLPSLPSKTTPERGCPKCGDPRVSMSPDPTEPESYSVIKCPACGWGTRCSSPAPTSIFDQAAALARAAAAGAPWRCPCGTLNEVSGLACYACGKAQPQGGA